MPKKKKKEKKKCPICGKNYNDYLAHIWGQHKTKTIAYLQKKRKSGSTKKAKSRSREPKRGFLRRLKDLIEEYE